MKILSKKRVIAVLSILTAVYGIIWLSRPVKIVAIHQRNNFSDVLVLNFPLTNRGKIDWWLKHKDMLKEQYAIPKRSSYGSFNITFWDFGEGYKEGEYDRLCFEDMPAQKNCIEKQRFFSIHDNGRGDITFKTSSQLYKQQPDGKIVPVESRVRIVR
ncbi:MULTISPECIES: DUF943 family protein [unclassified Brenneria]|uniref:DUF943 family protein n=1 Tax=unclassified Brenneria TaxID=2634434 RepID=UPI0029C4C2F4|nr:MULTISPECIES: DUF943 family protein [unclassified Brenneria]MDX5628284.1 DUF943 family protein [Brenneria sp. L3-3Z]MDX5695533.1 DUF943 family protein [Brenneria sp. L4-2C]